MVAFSFVTSTLGFLISAGCIFHASYHTGSLEKVFVEGTVNYAYVQSSSHDITMSMKCERPECEGGGWNKLSDLIAI